MVNLSNDPAMISILKEHRRWLPKIHVAPVPGSAQRILTQDKLKGEAVGEGKTILPSEKE